MEEYGLALLGLMRLRWLCVMGREEHQRELAAFLAFGIEAVPQVAYLRILILDAECRGFQLYTECGGFPLQAECLML